MTAVTGYAYAGGSSEHAATGSNGGVDTGTRDALFGGRVLLEQPARGAGYRVNVDALLLASFARARAPAEVAFDLGAGVGAVALSLLHFRAAKRVVLVEIDGSEAALAAKNLAANGWSESADVVHADVRDVARDRRAEAQLVVCNPPYVESGRGRLSPVPARARARSGALAVFVLAARAVAGRRARVCFVYPARELSTLCAALRSAGLEPKRIRSVHATPDSPARVVLVESQAAKAGGLNVMPPLVERVGGVATAEMTALLTHSRS
jgi:tRNA1Val (adenine37-N6)-methyltransferase